MPVHLLKQSIIAQRALVLGFTIILVLLFYQISASRLFNAQPLNTDGLFAIEQVMVRESNNWHAASLPHHGRSSNPLPHQSTTYRLSLPDTTPATGFALLIPSYRYYLEFNLNGKTLLTAGNKKLLWKHPTLQRVIIPLDLRDRGSSRSIIELTVSGAGAGRGLDKMWIGPLEKVVKARNPVIELLPSILNATMSALLLLIVFLIIDSSCFKASRLHLLLLIPHVILTFLLIPPEGLGTSLIWFKIYQSSFLITILAWGAFAYESAGIPVSSLKWPTVLTAVLLTPMVLSPDAETTRSWASVLVAPTAALLGIYLSIRCTIKRYRHEILHSNHLTLFLCSALLGAGLSDLLTIHFQNGFAQAISYPYTASLIAFALFARLALQMSDRTRELQLHQHSMSQLVRARTEALEQAQSKLIRHERFQTLNAMGAAISHEVRGPMGTLSSDVYMLKKLNNTRSEQEQTILQRMTRSVSRIDRTLSDLSSYVKRDQINTETLDFSNWLQQLLNDEEVKRTTKGAIIHLEIQEGLRLRFDADMLRRALINIINNAINACTDRYSPQLFVAAKQENKTIVIHIEDNGTGLAPELGESIFEPLVSGSKSGLGLGLSVVRDIMQLHNGRLEISNRADAKGAKVCLYLPLDEEQLSELATREASKRTTD